MPQAVCNIRSLAAEGMQTFKGLDAVDTQAAKVWMMALLYKALSGVDLTNICDFAATFRQYDDLSDYEFKAAQMQVLLNMLLQARVDQVTEEQARAAISCSHCCTVTPRSLEAAELCLWSLLTGYQAQLPT